MLANVNNQIFREKKNSSSFPEEFCKNDVHENFAKFTAKHLWQSLFFSKVADLRHAIF